MIINIGLWQRHRSSSATSAARAAAFIEPADRRVLHAVRQRSRGPARRGRSSSRSSATLLVFGVAVLPRRGPRPGRATSRPTRRPARRHRLVTDDAILRSGHLRRRRCVGELSQRASPLHELAGRRADASPPLSGGITNRNFLVTGAARSDRYVIRLAGNDTHLLGISREVEHAATVTAAGVGVGPEVVGVHPARGLPRHPVHRGLADARGGESTRRDGCERVADTLRRIHDGPAIPGLFVPFRIVEAYRALAIARRRADPARVRPRAGDRPADRARLPDRAARAPAVPQRPAERQLHRRRRADPDRRLGVRGDGRPLLRPRQLQHQPRARRRTRTRSCLRGLRRRGRAATGSPGSR